MILWLIWFSLVVITLILLVFFVYLSYQAVTTPTSGASQGYFLYSCEDRPCSGNLICDSDLLCKQPLGEPCLHASDCAAGYCNGVCTIESPTAITGQLGGPCPCDYNTQACVDHKCYSVTTCTTNSDCYDGACINGRCNPLVPDGGRCSNDSKCESGNCSLGVCQRVGVMTGEFGSYCTSACNVPLACQDDRCQIPG
jgi:hypothetical protein